METQMPDATRIWHYMPFWKFKSLLSKGPCCKGTPRCTLWFSRRSSFEEKTEGKCPEANVKRMERFAENEFGDAGLEELREELKKRNLRQRCAVFINCWHVNQNEYLEMWERYGGTPEGVAIQSTVGDVRFCLDLHGDGRVEYYRPAEGFKSDNIFGTQDKFLKGEGYNWEKEFRLEVGDDKLVERIEKGEEIKERELSPGIRVGISDVNRFINRLVVAPGASEVFLEKVKNLCVGAKMSWLAAKLVRSSFHCE